MSCDRNTGAAEGNDIWTNGSWTTGPVWHSEHGLGFAVADFTFAKAASARLTILVATEYAPHW